jgi:uncharacterized protein YfcZ (UPF0381/DUF406 family)
LPPSVSQSRSCRDQKPKQTAEERIRELNRKYREEQRAREQDRLGFEARLAALETGKKDLTPEKDGGKNTDEREPPNPKDLEKYPLGALDDRYIQDAIAFQAEKSAKEMVDSLLQRQEQSAQEAEAERQLAELRSKADNVAAKGTELHPDYQDVVVEAGMRGDYDLTQTTFEAAAEADHGAEILYALATDPAEASRVAKLSAFQQLKYVADKNAEIAGKGTSAKKIPGAGAPPQTIPAGKGGRKTISANTDNFEEFERLANSKSR